MKEFQPTARIIILFLSSGMELPFYFQKDLGNAIEETDKTYLVINKYRLPIGIIKIIVIILKRKRCQ